MTPVQVTVVDKTSELVPWLTFGASVGLALITLWYVVITAGILRQAQRVEDSRAHQQVQDQAGQIAAWVSNSAVTDRRVVVTTSVSNPSTQAVYDLQITLVDLDGGILTTQPHEIAVLGPGAAEKYETTCPLPPRASGALRTSLVFVDGQGIRWRRDERGALAPLSDEETPTPTRTE